MTSASDDEDSLHRRKLTMTAPRAVFEEEDFRLFDEEGETKGLSTKIRIEPASNSSNSSSHKTLDRNWKQRKIVYNRTSSKELTDGWHMKLSGKISRFLSHKKPRRRAILKNGDCNVVQSHISKRRRRFLQDIFTTLVDTQWRWTLLVFVLSFTLSWLLFAVIWWLIAYTHGDFEGDHDDPEWVPCVVGIKGFSSCFLFSIETQHTIGYGSRSTTEECPEAIFVMCLQSITGVFIQAFMVGIVFAKMARPKQRKQTLMFSRNAVICLRDGQLCLMIRVGDMREKSHLISSTVRAQIIKPRTTKEGEILSPNICDLKVHPEDYESDIFLIWPTLIIHEIDSSSPLYGISAADMLNEHFEIVVILEGTTESTGQTTQARASYLATEILWGHRFQSMVSYNRQKCVYQVNFSLFNNTYEVDTPLCSAMNLESYLDGADMEM